VFLVEEFEPAHLDDVGLIGSEVLREAYAPEFFLGMHELAPDLFLVARPYYSQRAIGFLVGSQASTLEARLLLLAVRPELQSRGVGHRLMEEFLRRLRANGVREASLEVRQGNMSAIRFYRQFGFDVGSSLEGFYADGESAFVMRRAL
jgi:ribosomal-protein-alanine N-acetyltransferase